MPTTSSRGATPHAPRRVAASTTCARSGREAPPGRAILSRATADVNGRASIESQLGCRARPVGGNLQMIGAAEETADFTVRDVGIGRDELWHPMRPDLDLDAAAPGQSLHFAPVDIRNQIAEPIDAE